MSFESIAATSDRSSDVYRLSEEDRDLILTQIATSDLKLPLQSASTTNRYQQLESLRRKELTLTLHASTLAEYVRVKRIPRGLRTHLTPNLLTDKSIFTSRWYGLCNQLSFDLMLLSIKHLQEEIDVCKDDIRILEKEIRDNDPPSKVEASLLNIDEAMGRLRESIMKVKLHKFARDTKDYANDEVYTWNKKRPRRPTNPPHPQKQQSRHLQDTTASDSEDSMEFSHSKKPFLGLQRTIQNPNTIASDEEIEGPSSYQRPQTRAQRARGRGRPTRRR